MDVQSEGSPIVERPLNVSSHGKQSLREASGSTLPAFELDPTVRTLLQENEAMLFEISGLRESLESSHENIAQLKEIIADKDKELQCLRERLGGAYVDVNDASGKVINYKNECDRLAAENKQLADENKKVCAELENHTDNIRNGVGCRRCESGRNSVAAQINDLRTEILSILPTFDRIFQSLKRCVVFTNACPGRVRESVEKELNMTGRLLDSARRMSPVDETRVKEIQDRLQHEDAPVSTGDLAITMRWMIVQAFTAGLLATEGNLKTIDALVENENKGRSDGKGAPRR